MATHYQEASDSPFPGGAVHHNGAQPLMVQDALDANLAVIHNQNGQAVIVSEPAEIKTWRVDQILTSKLFELNLLGQSKLKRI